MNNLSPEKQAALNLLEEGNEYYAYFFHKAHGLDLLHPLKEKGYFSASENPEPVAGEKEGYVHIPYWPVLSYLEKAAKESVSENTKEYQVEILGIIKDVTLNSDEGSKENYRTWHSFSKILSIMPVEILEQNHIDLLDIWLDCRFDGMLVSEEINKGLLPNLLASKEEHACVLINEIVKHVVKVTPPNKDDTSSMSFREVGSRIEKYWLKRLLERHSRKIGRKCGIEPVKIFLSAFTSVENLTGENDYSVYWRPSVDDSEQNIRSEEIITLLFTALRETLLGAIEADADSVEELVKSLYDSDRTILNRLAIYISTEKYDRFGDAFWLHRRDNVLDSKCKHEIYMFLHKCFSRFDEVNKGLILDSIEGLREELYADDKGDDEENRIKREAYKKLSWLKAIKDCEYDSVKEMYENYTAIAGGEPEHPEFPVYMGKAEWVQEKSDYTVEQLLDMSIDETQALLDSYEESGGWRAPTKDGLGRTLKEAVKLRPEKYTQYLRKFVNVEYIYQYYILQAYTDLWREKTTFDVGKVLDHCDEIIIDNGFWENADNVPEEYYGPTTDWILSQIADFIRSGVQDDEHAFEEKNLEVIEKLLITILNNEKSNASGDESDPVSYAINSSRGRCIEALFSYSLRMCRLEDKSLGNHEGFWSRIEPIYDNEISMTDTDNYEFSTLCGNYLPNLFYMSKSWAEENFNKIFSTKNTNNWRCAIHGYSYVNTVYENIYSLFKANGHFKKVIEKDFSKEHVRNKIIEHIMVGYLRGVEPFDDDSSLIVQILREWRREDLLHINWFLWTNRDSSEEKIIERVVEYWSRCVEIIDGNKEENKSILSGLNMLSAFLPKLEERYIKLLYVTAPYSDVEHHTSHLIEDLHRLLDSNPDAVGDIFLSMLESSTPYYDKKYIRGIVNKLYSFGKKDKADAICNHYLKSGMVNMVQDIYEKNRRKI